MLRARPTSWFELITSREDLARAMQVLAESGAVQLEAGRLDGTVPVLPHLDGFFAEYDALEKRFGPYWPSARGSAGAELANPIAALEKTLAVLGTWGEAAEPQIRIVQDCDAHRRELELIALLAAHLDEGYPLERLYENESDILEHRIFFLPGGVPADLQADGVLFESFETTGGAFVVMIADQPEMSDIEVKMAALKAVPVPLPRFLRVKEESGDFGKQIDAKLAANDETRARACDRLAALNDRFGLDEALSRVAVLKWLRDNSGDLRATRHTIRVTGWTDDADGNALRRALDAAGVNYVLSVSAADPAGDAPIVLNNPGWLRVFEFFPGLLGVPGHGGIDPSAVTALVAPVLFGFMFGDVGQGAVLLVAGLLLHRRIPLLSLLVPGGLAAMVFGVLFGSVFSLEHVIPALWLRPLDEPVTVLATALALGVVLLILAQALDLLQALWRGQTWAWLRRNGGITLAYVAVLSGFWHGALLWGVPLGIAASLAGASEDDGGWSPPAALAALAEFLEAIMRLLVSTVSFSRVGAFALAHAGLSAAIVGIGEAAGGAAFWVVLFVGNIVIIALEGLITGIQTTRLILFEFFIRFFRAEGRTFLPLASPRVRMQTIEGKKP